MSLFHPFRKAAPQPGVTRGGTCTHPVTRVHRNGDPPPAPDLSGQFWLFAPENGGPTPVQGRDRRAGPVPWRRPTGHLCPVGGVSILIRTALIRSITRSGAHRD